MTSKSFGNNVKVGITFDPRNRIRNMQTCNPEPVRYLRIYTITNTNNMTLKNLETMVGNTFIDFKYQSNDFQEAECKPQEFYLNNIVEYLDTFMIYLKNNNYIDYITFFNLATYMEREDELFDVDVYETLKGIDMDYEESDKN
jgi:hypothetical protein